MRILGVVLLILGQMLGIGSNLPVFVDPPSIIIVAVFTIAVLLISGVSIPAMFTALGSGPLSDDERARAASAWGLAEIGAVAGGAVGVVVGAVIMLRNLDDLAAIGPGAAICLLTLLYGLVVGYGICRPCRRYVENRQAS